MYSLQCIVYSVYHTMYTKHAMYVYYTWNLSRPKEAASNLPKSNQFWKVEAILEAILEAGSNFSVSFQPAGGRMIPKRGSEEQICWMIPEGGYEQLEIRNKK